MFIDYKIILILVLSIVCLIIYNKLEYVSSETKKLEEKNKNLEEEIFEIKMKIKNLENAESKLCPMPTKSTNKIVNSKNEEKEDNILNKINNIYNNEFKLDKDLDTNDKNSTVEKDTNEYNATEEHDSDTEITNIESDNVIVYSNEKKSDKDSSNLLEVDKLIDQLAEKDIVQANIDYTLEVIDSSNSVDSNKNMEFDKDTNNFVKDINVDIDYEKKDSDIPTSEKKVSIKELMAFKLNELQTYAKDNNIDITKLENGKVKNKTKKELCVELQNK